jgi:hypothetical protein
MACFGNPLGAAKTDDAVSNEQMLAKAKKIDFMNHPYDFVTGRYAQSVPNPIATSRASHAPQNIKKDLPMHDLTVARISVRQRTNYAFITILHPSVTLKGVVVWFFVA